MANARGCKEIQAAPQGTDSRFFREFSGYAIPTEQSDRVPGIRHKVIVHQGPGMGRIQVTKARPFTQIVVFGIRDGLWFPNR